MIPAQPGTYVLLLQATTPQPIQVGRLGSLLVQAGYYLYVGSALGPGGLAARINRHLRQDKKPHWHIDYLRAVTEVVDVRWQCDPLRRECAWAEQWQQVAGATIPLAGFGSSDCGCESHLVWFKSKWSVL